MIRNLIKGLILSSSLFLTQFAFASTIPTYTGLSHYEEFDFTTYTSFHKFIAANINAPVIEIDLNSPGGYVTSLNNMLADLKMYHGIVITKAHGMVASCAAILYSVGNIHKADPGAIILFHQIYLTNNRGDSYRTPETFLESVKMMPYFKAGMTAKQIVSFLSGADVEIPAGEYITHVGH